MNKFGYNINRMSEQQVYNRTMPPCTVIPILAYPNVDEAIPWLMNAFGFTLRWRMAPHRTQLAFKEGCVVVTDGFANEPEVTGNEPNARTHSVMIRVTNIDGHFANAVKHGAIVLHGPRDFFYGERQYSVKDIGGHTWTFSQSIRDVRPSEWGAEEGESL